MATPKSVTSGVPAGEHHVVGLDVAVDHPALVGVGQRVGHLAQDPERLVDRQGAVTLEPGAERLAFDERHDVIEEAGGLAGVVEREDVGVLQLGGDLDFAEEPVGPQSARPVPGAAP